LRSKVPIFILKITFVACCEEFQEHFPVEATDHSYDDICQNVRKTVELFRKNDQTKEQPKYEWQIM
jgi:hypothetical protein